MKPIKLSKIEHHSVNYYSSIEFEYDLLEEIYPDHTKKELKEIWKQMQAGNESVIADVLNDAFGEVDIEWNSEYEDNWTDRKGGYDITYGLWTE